jgi:membrane protein DedA with SNARE-associated domain
MNDITQFLMGHGGPVLFAIVFAEQAGLPLPSAPWLLAAGALSASGKLNPALAIGVTALAAVMADSLWFYVGRRGGERVLRFFCRLSLARNSCVCRTKGLFDHYGLQALVAAKFLPGLGVVMPPLAGALGMSTTRFLVFDGLGSLFYGTFYIVAGSVFHNQLQRALGMLSRLGFGSFVLALVVVAGYIAFKYARRRERLSREGRQKAEKTAEGPGRKNGRAHQSASSLTDEQLNNAEFPDVALALTRASSPGVEAQTAGLLVPHSL